MRLIETIKRDLARQSAIVEREQTKMRLLREEHQKAVFSLTN